MPSVRVRRNHPYAGIPGSFEDDLGPESPTSPRTARQSINLTDVPDPATPQDTLRPPGQTQTQTRARSRTITHIFGPGEPPSSARLRRVTSQPQPLACPAPSSPTTADPGPESANINRVLSGPSTAPSQRPILNLPFLGRPVSTTVPKSPSTTSMRRLRIPLPPSPAFRPRSGSTASASRPSIDLVLTTNDGHSRTDAAIRSTEGSLHGRDVPASGNGNGADLDLELDLEEVEEEEHHHDEVVDHLDVIDPTVSTVGHLANAANSIILPPVFTTTRKPVVDLPSLLDSQEQLLANAEAARSGEQLDELDRHVESCLTKRQKVRRALHGLWAFLKTPMGVLTGIYGFLVVFWGAGIVLFLLKWINLHNDNLQGLWVEITCQVETGLFTITGVGLIPWRSIDTYRIVRIAHYKFLTRKLRRKAKAPALADPNDIPDPELEATAGEYVRVLTPEQEAGLHYQQQKFSESQTWYRPHETDTHRAFSITTALWICLLIDGNSLFQCMLCGTMWGLNRYNRPAWSTGTLVPASFLCGIAAAVLIWKGGQRTKKVVEVEQKLREALDIPPEGDTAADPQNGKRSVLGDSTSTGTAVADREKERELAVKMEEGRT